MSDTNINLIGMIWRIDKMPNIHMDHNNSEVFQVVSGDPNNFTVIICEDLTFHQAKQITEAHNERVLHLIFRPKVVTSQTSEEGNRCV